MTSWIFGLIGAALACCAWWIIRAGLERERRQALMHRRRDRTGRATLGALGSFGRGSGDERQADTRVRRFERKPLATTSLDHVSTLPASFTSGNWPSPDSCSPPSADHSSGYGCSSSD